MRKLVIATLLASMAAAPAIAEDRDGRQDMTIAKTIAVSDLDLGTASGLRQLRQRIASATETVCGSYAGVEEYERIRIKACRDQVGRQLRPQVARLTGTSNVRMSAAQLR